MEFFFFLAPSRQPPYTRYSGFCFRTYIDRNGNAYDREGGESCIELPCHLHFAIATASHRRRSNFSFFSRFDSGLFAFSFPLSPYTGIHALIGCFLAIWEGKLDDFFLLDISAHTPEGLVFMYCCTRWEGNIKGALL